MEEPDYCLWLVSRAYTADTIRGYLGILHVWRDWCLAHGPDPYDASQSDLARWLLERRHLSTNTVRNSIIGVRVLYRFLGGPNPTKGAKLPRPQLPPVIPYSHEELLRLLAACRKPRDRALFYILLGSGLRACEIMRLRKGDIDWERGVLRIRGKGGRYRLVTPGQKAMAALGECGELRITTVSGLKSWIRRLGVKARVHPAGLHRFRVTYAVSFLGAGGSEGSLQKLLGHSGLGMTLHYAEAARAALALKEGQSFNPADAL